MNKLRGIILILVLALVAGAAGAWLGGRYLGPHPRTSSFHDLLHDELDLTAEQERRIERLEAEFAPRREALQIELRQANLELAAALRGRKVYSPEAQAAIDHFHETMGDLQTATIVHVLQMRAVLTPEQARLFDQRIQESLTEERL